MKRFKFRIYTIQEPEDGFNVWVEARNEKEAQEEVRREYHSIHRLSYYGQF